jgi:hypothetical protein
MRTQASPDEVRAAVLKNILESDGMVESWRVAVDVAGTLGIDQSQSSRLLRQSWDRFTGQVSRALNKLADEGTVRKVGRDQLGPDGSRGYGGAARYYTPEAWQQAEREYERRERELAGQRARWGKVHDALLDEHGLASATVDSTGIRLSLEDWEKLLEALP